MALSRTNRLFALLFAPLMGLCLVTAGGCEEGDVDGVGNGVEIEEEDELGDDEVEIEGE